MPNDSKVYEETVRIIKQLNQNNVTIADIAAESGIPDQWIRNVVNHETNKTYVDRLEALNKHVKKRLRSVMRGKNNG